MVCACVDAVVVVVDDDDVVEEGDEDVVAFYCRPVSLSALKVRILLRLRLSSLFVVWLLLSSCLCCLSLIVDQLIKYFLPVPHAVCGGCCDAYDSAAYLAEALEAFVFPFVASEAFLVEVVDREAYELPLVVAYLVEVGAV